MKKYLTMKLESRGTVRRGTSALIAMMLLISLNSPFAICSDDINKLIEKLSDEDANVRSEAAKALVEIGKPECMPIGRNAVMQTPLAIRV